MVVRQINIGRWDVEFYFASDGYDSDVILDRLFDLGAPSRIMRSAMELMDSGKANTGFTFSNPYDRCALIAIGPSDNSSEFLNTLVHEIHHLAVAIAGGLGVDLEGETPAYIAGDSAFALAQIVCELGCDRCN